MRKIPRQGQRAPAAISQCAADRADHDPFTTVHTAFVEGRFNYRVLFGQVLRIETLHQEEGITRQIYTFEKGSRFALDLWDRNVYGTIHWLCYVCEPAMPGAQRELVPFVIPGVRVLLSTKGAAQSRLFLAWLRDLEGRGVDVLNCPAETFEAAHFRLQGSRADITPPWHLNGRITQ